MGLSKKPETDKKPISREKLAKLLTSAKKPTINAKLPSLTEVPTQKPAIKIPTAIEPARAEGTSVAKKFQPGYTPSEVFNRTLDNTVNMMAGNTGIQAPEKGSYEYNVIKDDILKNKPNLATTVNDEGSPVFGLKTSGADAYMSGLNDFSNYSDKGFDYALSDATNNTVKLEDIYKKRFTKELPRVTNPILNTFGLNLPYTPVEQSGQYMAGQLTKPLSQGITGAVTGAGVGAATTGPFAPIGAPVGFVAGALTTFALSSPDGVAVKYGTSLEDAYTRARDEGFTKDEAYEKANSVAKAAAGGEVGMQVIYSMFGTPATSAIPKAKIINEGAKKGFAEAASKFVKKSYEFVKPGAFLGTEAALATGVSEAQAAKEGLDTEKAVEKAISTGSDFAVLDMAIRGALGIVKIPGYLKAQTDNLLQTADRKVVREFTKQGELDGVYPSGSTNKLSTKISNFEASKQQSPKYPGDDAREAVVSGLTQKLNGLIDEQGKLADVHKADLQGQIDDVKLRIEKAKTAKNPLEAELNEDGTPLVLTDKTKTNATTEAKGQVKESVPESGVVQREGVIGEQQKEVPVEETTNKASDSNRPVIGEEEVAPTVTFADQIRKFKIDESILTGGDKGVAQSNIVGLPIAIYNASIEAIAKGVEAGGKLAELIEQQIKSLREGGYANIDEVKFRKNVGLIDRVSTDKSRIKAESEMSGIKSADYTSLQRFALEKYNEASGIYKDPEMLAKALRDELDKKMNTSAISNDVFEMIGYDAVANESKAPFVPKPATKATMETLGYEPDEIITKPKDVFKAMYTAATNVGKSVQERVMGAANMVSEYIKKKDKLTVAPKDIAKAIGRLVTSKMDSETASKVFAENLSDIIENARDANQISANKATIKKIKKDANSPTYGTIATKETTEGIDFMSPAKIKDSVNPDNVSDVTILASEKRRKYQELLEDYRNSITGNPTKSRTARLDLIEFIDAEKRNFEEFKERQAVDKRAKSGAKYDNLVAEKKIDENTVSREEFIDADVNPTKAVSDEVDEAIAETEVDKVEAYKEVVEGKRRDLRDELDNGDIDPMDIDDVNYLLNAPLDKISPRNLKLLSNIIEDVLNGERPSRVGDIKSDIQVFDNINSLKTGISRIRDISKAKFAGITKSVRKFFDKSYTGSKEAYDELGITNMIRAFTMNAKDEAILRSTILGAFEKAVKIVNTQSKKYTDTLYQIFAKDNVTINGKNINLKNYFGTSVDVNNLDYAGMKNVPPLSEKNSQKIGMVAALLNFDNPTNTVNSIIESTKMLDAIKGGKYTNMVKERLLALKDLGIIDIVPSNSDEIQAMQLIESIDSDAILSSLNKRERLALDFIINENKKIAPGLNKVNRNYFGESVDMSNPNYVGMQTFFTDALEDFETAFDQPIFNVNQVNKLRASSTMQRSKEMINPALSKGRAVHYDFDVFTTQPKRYHESLTTMMTTEQTRMMAKMFAKKEFQDLLKGKYNIDKNLLDENMKVFKNIVTEYVNGERKPYVVTREIARQRGAISKFFYSRMLNSLEAGALQYIPNLPSLIIESPQSFAKAMEVTTSSLFDNEKSQALIKFLSQTSKASRVNAGFEALTKSAKSISDNATLRFGSNLYKNIDNFAGLSIDFGDRLTTVQSLLTGYIKGLIKSGKIKNASEFDLVSEVEKGLDQYALSNAETFMSFINNESSTYAKAKVFRKDYASVLKMLQSFSHNSATNFLVDLGRFSDETAVGADRAEALKRMTQYLFTTAGYGLSVYYVNDMKTKFARDYMKSRGIIKEDEDLNKAVTEDREKTKALMTTSTIFESMLSRQNVVAAEMIKGSLDMGYDLLKKPFVEEKQKMGEDIRNTVLSNEYSPFFKSEYLGTAGSFLGDVEQLVGGLIKDASNDDYRSMLSEKQKEAYNTIRILQASGMFLPSKDIRRLGAAANKALKQGRVTQLEMDAQNYIVATSSAEDGDYSNSQIEEAKSYVNEQRGKAKSKNEFDSYMSTTVKDFAENNIQKQEMIAKAKQFGDGFARDVANIKSAPPNKKLLILNNRFPGRTIKDSIVKFMLDNKVITPEDYGMSLLFDKNGKPRNEVETSLLYSQALSRYRDAKYYLRYKVDDAKNLQLGIDAATEQRDFEEKFNKMKSERYMRGKVLQ